MKEKMKKLLSMLLVLAMVLAMVTGCGNTDGDSDDQENDGAEDTLSGKITISVRARAGAQEAWEAVGREYTKMHPNVEVVVDLKASEGYTDYIANLNLDETEVDIGEFMGGAFDHSRLMDLSGYLDIDSPYSEGTWGEQFEAAALGQSPVNDDLVQLSMFATQVLWIYNADIFEEVGVEVPETWDELVTVCEKIAAAGYQPITTTHKTTLEWLNQIYMDQTNRDLVELIAAQEGDYCYDPDVDGNWELDLTDPWNDTTDKVNQNIVRALKLVKDGTIAMNTEGGKTVWNCFKEVFPKYAGGDAYFGTDEGISDAFYKGEAAMTIQGGWALISFKNTLDEAKELGSYTDEDGNKVEAKGFELGTFSMPTMEGDGIVAKARSIELPTSGFCVLNKDQEHNDLVADFLMYYTSKEGMSLYVDTYLSAGGSVDGPCLTKGVEYSEEYTSLFENLKNIGNVQCGYRYYFVSGVITVTESERQFSNYSYEFLNGNMSVEDFLEKADENVLNHFSDVQQILNISDTDIENPASAPAGF